jgi:hypothetical protein
MRTAKITEAIIEGSVIHIGFNPRKMFLSVPPETEAMAAINAIPP